MVVKAWTERSDEVSKELNGWEVWHVKTTPWQKPGAGYAAVIGDIVGSTRHRDRRALQRAVQRALDDANGRLPSLQPLRVTLGDEFQGLYTTLGDALEATLLLRLHLRGEADVRFGIGWGLLSIYEPTETPFAQDGPAWWAARRAVGAVRDADGRRGSARGWRTSFSSADRAAVPDASTPRRWWYQPTLPGLELPLPNPTPLPPLPDDFVNAYLLCRDELVGQLDDRDTRLLLGLLRGARQSTLAEAEGVSASAVTQRLAKSGAYALIQSMDALRRMEPWRR